MFRIVLLSLILSVPLIAQSQEPGTGAFVSGRNQKEHTGQIAEKGSKYNRGTEQNPIFVKELHTEPSTTERNAEAKDREQKASYERWSSISTIVIAIFTVILGISTVGLWIVTIRGARHTEKAANAAQESALAISSTERAYIFVKEVALPYGLAPHTTAYLTYFNAGRTFAVLNKNDMQFRVIDAGEYPKPEFEETALAKGLFLRGNADLPLEIGELEIDAEDVRKIKNRNRILICYGRVAYKDIFGNPQQTIFCWEYNPESGTFYISPTDELNHNT